MDPSLQLVTKQKIMSLAREKVDQGKGWLQLGWGKGQLQLAREGKEDLILLKPHFWWCAFDIFCSVCGISATTCMRVWPSVASWSLGESLTWGWAPLGRSVSRQSPLPHPPTRTRTHSTNLETIFVGINLEFRDMGHVLNHLFREKTMIQNISKASEICAIRKDLTSLTEAFYNRSLFSGSLWVRD